MPGALSIPVPPGRTTGRSGLLPRLGAGLAALGILCIALAVLLVAAVNRYEKTVQALSHDMNLAQHARSLGVSAREQYIHEAHAIILRDRSHATHSGSWADRFRREAVTLAGELPEAERRRLRAIVQSSASLETVFATQVYPAVEGGDLHLVRVAHERAESIVDAMTLGADALAEQFERRAREGGERARTYARGASTLGAVLAGLAALLALAIARSVWNAAGPALRRLERTARSVAAGDTRARAGSDGPRELAVVGEAFDQMLDRLAEREAALVDAERLATVGRIAAGVAHEINNPIGVIRGYLKTMRAETMPPQLAEELAILDEEALACQRIADDLLTYARAPSLQRERVSVPSLVQDVVQRVRAGGEIGECEVQSSVEAADVELDPLRVRQVLSNLLRNASQSMDAHGTIDVSGARSGGQYKLRIEDRGRGIALQVRTLLFEPFATNRADGRGLGLAVCKRLVEAHGGTIVFRDRPGGGTTFEVSLPVDASAQAQDGAA